MLRRYTRLRSYTRPRPVRLKPRRGKIEDPAYLRWIRALPCLIGNRECRGSSDPHHVGHYGQARRNDHNAVPLCRIHHDENERLNNAPFEEKYGLDFEVEIARLRAEYEQRGDSR